MRAPFTAVIFALELTHDVESLPPLLIAAVMAYGFTVLVMKRSILTEKVARRGYDIFREYTVDPLETYKVSDAMTAAVVTINESLPASEIYDRYFSSSQKHRGFPVVDSNERLLGILTISDLMEASLSEPDAALTAGDLLQRRQESHHMLLARRFTHESDSPDFSRERTQTTADFNVEFGQKRLANQRLIRVLGDCDAIESGQAMPFLGLESTTEGRKAGYQCRTVATVAREAGLKALRMHIFQLGSKGVNMPDTRGAGSHLALRVLLELYKIKIVAPVLHGRRLA